jgi:hypothetical protein
MHEQHISVSANTSVRQQQETPNKHTSEHGTIQYAAVSAVYTIYVVTHSQHCMRNDMQRGHVDNSMRKVFLVFSLTASYSDSATNVRPFCPAYACIRIISFTCFI